MGTLFSVQFQLEVPVDATEDEVEAWLRFELGETCSIMSDNPLCNHSVEASNVSAWKRP